MAEIVLNNLNKEYGKQVKVVDDFNLHVKDKEFIVLVGPSGCGKSTTLRMIAGLEEITSGEFYIDGKLMNDCPPKDRDIAMVFQNYALYPHKTVYENMAFGLKLRKFKKAEIQKRVNEAAEILGLENLLKRKPKELSGGQRQRVALGRAIVRDAKVFLMDEPLSNLDAKLRFQMRAEISKLHQRLKTTTVYVTHDQTEAMTMATRIVIMKDGKIQQVGKPKEVYDFPVNMFVGGFLGSPAMNFLKGRIEGDWFIEGEHSVQIPADKLATLTERGYIGKEVILGIRPECIQMSDTLQAGEVTTITSEIIVSEVTGAETIIYSNFGKQEFIARIESNSDIQPGQVADFHFNLEKAHFFDPETEMRICDK